MCNKVSLQVFHSSIPWKLENLPDHTARYVNYSSSLSMHSLVQCFPNAVCPSFRDLQQSIQSLDLDETTERVR
jgi:hypothetical protein